MSDKPQEKVEEKEEKQDEVMDEKVKKEPAKKAETKQQELVQATRKKVTDPGISVLQFVRTENLGLFKDGFIKHVSLYKLGGKRPRYEWKSLYSEYMKMPRKITC